MWSLPPAPVPVLLPRHLRQRRTSRRLPRRAKRSRMWEPAWRRTSLLPEPAPQRRRAHSPPPPEEPTRGETRCEGGSCPRAALDEEFRGSGRCPARCAGEPTQVSHCVVLIAQLLEGLAGVLTHLGDRLVREGLHPDVRMCRRRLPLLRVAVCGLPGPLDAAESKHRCLGLLRLPIRRLPRPLGSASTIGSEGESWRGHGGAKDRCPATEAAVEATTEDSTAGESRRSRRGAKDRCLTGWCPPEDRLPKDRTA